jgi:hypothetical protein
MRNAKKKSLSGGALALFFTILACGALAGCAEEVATAPNPCGAKTCDILERDCQEEVLKLLRCYRGGDEDVMPDVEVISEDEYIELVTGEEPTEEMQQTFERFSRAMAMLKLAPAMQDQDETIEEYASNIAAAYLTDTESVVIIDRGKPLDTASAVATFAHELVHALQDREIGFEDFYQSSVRPSLDGTLAARALIEGEATHYDLLVFAALSGAGPQRINWAGYYTNYQLEMLLNGYEDDAPLALSFIRFPYAFGGDFVSDTWLWSGQPGVEALFENPPQTTADVITLSVLDEEGLADVAEFREQSKLVAADGYELVAYDELGSFVLDSFLHRMKVTDDVALDVRALYVRADGVTVLYDEAADQVAVAWRMHFEEDRVPDGNTIRGLREALGAPDEDAPEPGDDVKARVYADERDVYIIASDGPLPEAWLGEDVMWEPAPLDEQMAEEMPNAAHWRRLITR